MLSLPVKPIRILVMLAIAGFTANGACPAVAGDCGCETVCTECSHDSCDCACECGTPHRPNLIYKALDKVAGGIEKALGLDKIHCDPCGNEITCDDGCDAAMFDELSTFSEPSPHHGSLPIAPAPPLSAPSIESVPSYSEPSHESAPQTRMRMGEPTMSDPYVPSPQPSLAPEPSQVPHAQPRQPLGNPFEDDAQVTGKRRVRATNFENNAKLPAPRAKPRKPSNRRYSRSYTPSKRLARSVR